MTTIRCARTYDATAIAALCGELGYPSTRQQVVARLAAIENVAAKVFVAENGNGDVVAWLYVGVCAQLTGDDEAEILGLVAAADTRGNGIGGMLVERAVAWARERGCTRLRVRSRAERERAHRFYEREGFERVKTQRVFARRIG